MQDEIDQVKRQTKDFEKKIDGIDAEIEGAKKRGDRDEVAALRAEKQQLRAEKQQFMARVLQLGEEKHQLVMLLAKKNP